MKTNYLYLCGFLILSFCTTACKKYEARYDGTWDDSKAKEGLTLHVIRNIVYAMPDGIWTTDGINAPKHVFTDNSANIERVSISPNFDKIAFSKSTGTITVIDSNGRVLATNQNPTNVEHFEWYSDNNHLYGTQNVTNNKKVIALYGGVISATIPSFTFNNSGEELLFAYITKDNDLFYSTRLSNSYAKLYYKKSSATGVISRTDYNYYNSAPTNIRMTNDNTIAYLFNSPTTYLSSYSLSNRTFSYSGGNYQTETFININSSSYLNDYLGLKYFNSSNDKCPNGCYIADTKVFDVK